MELTLRYSVTGEGPPLLLLHGLFGSRRNWHHIAARLAGQFRVYTADLRNHGDSPWAAAMDYASMAADVGQLIEDIAPGQKIVVAGHSMGGKVAMMLALRHPEQVRRLVVLDVAPATYPDRYSALIHAAQSCPLRSVVAHADADKLLAPAIADPAVRKLLLQNLVRRSNGYAWRINFDALDAGMAGLMGFPPPPQSRPCELPALFVRGIESDYLLPDHHEKIAQLFPRAEHLSLSGAGHWLHVDQPAALAQAIAAPEKIVAPAGATILESHSLGEAVSPEHGETAEMARLNP
ncbi:MAG: alpha/beta fold hydrolase [bacterium]